MPSRTPLTLRRLASSANAPGYFQSFASGVARNFFRGKQIQRIFLSPSHPFPSLPFLLPFPPLPLPLVLPSLILEVGLLRSSYRGSGGALWVPPPQPWKMWELWGVEISPLPLKRHMLIQQLVATSQAVMLQTLQKIYCRGAIANRICSNFYEKRMNMKSVQCIRTK